MTGGIQRPRRGIVWNFDYICSVTSEQPRYLKKAQCIISQYGNYTIKDLDNMQLNGINTQGENIADNGGIKEAYRAYSELPYIHTSLSLALLDTLGLLTPFLSQDSWVSQHGTESRLPGLNYTPRQLFWVSLKNPPQMTLGSFLAVHSRPTCR